MFKATAQNAQLRTRRVALESRENTAGIDPSVFKPELDRVPTLRESLVLRKLELESKASKLRGEMSVATSRKRNRLSGQVEDSTFHRWATELASARNEIKLIDAKLLHLRVDGQIKEDERQKTKAEIFVQVAREMLADPIFKALMRKAAERMETK